MTLKSQTGISLRHAATIVNDLYGRTASIDHNDLNMMGTGINGILYQFFNDGGRTLDNLAGRYLIGYGVGQQLDNIAHSVSSFLLPRHRKMSSLDSGRT